MFVVLGLMFALEPTVYLLGKRSEGEASSRSEWLKLVYGRKNAVKISYIISAALFIAAAVVLVCFNAEML